jgi:photosystem II stability/assembly factor-like uncharacterized protein
MKKITFALALLFSFSAHCQWTSVTSGTGQKIDAIHFNDALNGYCAGGFTNILKTTNGGNTWTSTSTLNARDISFSGTTGYIASVSGTAISKSTNGGTTWTSLTPPTSNSLWGVAAVSSTTAYVVGTGGVMWRTTNGGTSFSVLSTGTVSELVTDVVFTSATTGMILSQGSGIKRTTNGWTTWTLVQPALSMTEMCFVDANIGYAVGSSNKVFKTIDGGASWTQLTLGLTGTIHLEGVHFFDANNGIAVGLSGKIVYTNDGGTTWNLQNSGVTTHLRDVRMLSATKAVVVGDNGKILKNESITWLGTDDLNLGKVTIYPNPVNNTLNIKSEQPFDAVRITDMAGHVVSELKTAFESEMQIDMAACATGIYFVTVASGTETVVGKIVKQ